MQPAPGLAEMRRLITGFSLTIAISAAAELGIADHLVKGARSAAELARLGGVHEDFLRRMLRYLASEGVFEERPGDLFALTERSHWLRSDVPGSLRPRAAFTGSRFSWTAWGHLLQSLRTGTSAFHAAFGEDIFDYLKHDAAAGAAFNSFMAGQTAASVDAVLAAYDFTGVRELAEALVVHSPCVAPEFFNEGFAALLERAAQPVALPGFHAHRLAGPAEARLIEIKPAAGRRAKVAA